MILKTIRKYVREIVAFCAGLVPFFAYIGYDNGAEIAEAISGKAKEVKEFICEE